jgi:hypothetical protein
MKLTLKYALGLTGRGEVADDRPLPEFEFEGTKKITVRKGRRARALTVREKVAASYRRPSMTALIGEGDV